MRVNAFPDEHTPEVRCMPDVDKWPCTTTECRELSLQTAETG